MKINTFTHDQLLKIKDLLPEDWETKLHFIIPNTTLSNPRLPKIGDKFIIKVENYIINQPSNFSLAENWNGGTVPPEQILDVEIIQIMGNMTKVKAVGKCTNIKWEGWLPNKSFKIV